MHGAQSVELITHAVIRVRPATHIHHTAHQFRPLQCHPLTNAGTNTNQADKVDIGHAKVVQQADNIVRMQFCARRDGQVVVRFANPPVVHQQNGILVGHAPGEKVLPAMTKGIPTTDVHRGRTITVKLVVHSVVVNRRSWHC